MSGYMNPGYYGATLQDERRIVLVGKTGVGKSAAGNTILGREAFESDLSPSSLTSNCQKAKGEVDGRSVAVIDTPGLFDTNFTQEEVLNKIKMCISLSAPGPHAFLVVLQLGRFTQEEKDTVKMIQTTFGEDAANYSMVLFTHGDQLKNQTIEGFISESPELRILIQQCRNRYHVFNNEIKDPKQRSRLMDKIEDMIMENGGGYYTNAMFKRAELAIQKEKERILKEMEAEKKRELDELRARCAGSVYRREETRVHMKYEHTARARAEKSNDFTSAPAVAIAAVCGAAVGGLLGIAGGPIGMAVGAAAGAAAGAAIGAVAVGLSKAPRKQKKRDELRIIMVGKTGGGKSATGNTILGRKAFESELSPSSWTVRCKKAEGEVEGRRVAIVDTPGLFDTNVNEEDEVLKKLKTCVSLSAPGPHVFLVVLKLGRFTPEEENTIDTIQTTFGDEAAKYSLVLFTHGDKLKKQTIESFISKSEKLKELIQTYHCRYHVFNNEVKDREQVTDLMTKIDTIVLENGGRHYSSKMFRKAKKASKKEKRRLSKEMKAAEQQRKSTLKAKVKSEMDLNKKPEKCVLQ